MAPLSTGYVGYAGNRNKVSGRRSRYAIHATVFIGEEDTMVNKIVVVDKIVHLGPPLGHCGGLLHKIVW